MKVVVVGIGRMGSSRAQELPLHSASQDLYLLLIPLCILSSVLPSLQWPGHPLPWFCLPLFAELQAPHGVPLLRCSLHSTSHIPNWYFSSWKVAQVLPICKLMFIFLNHGHALWRRVATTSGPGTYHGLYTLIPATPASGDCYFQFSFGWRLQEVRYACMFPLPRLPLSPRATTVRSCVGTAPENRGLESLCPGFASGPLHLLAM